MGEQYNNFAESCGRNHSKFSKPIYNFALFAFHLVRGFGIFNPRSSICPRLSWRRLKAGSRCRLGQQVRLNKVPKKYLLHTARNQPVLRPTDKISKHCIFSLQLQWRNLQIHYRSYLSRYPQPTSTDTFDI